jgi:hypothetical protein
MSVFRIYPEKSNTIASGLYKHFNAGQNAIADLWYGGGGTDTAPEKRNSYSRFIVKFDLSDLQSKINNKEILTGNTISYRLKMKNSIPKDKLLEPEYEFDVLNKGIASSFDLISFPINKDWDQGRGYDLTKEFYAVKALNGNSLITGYSNWDYAKLTTLWDEPGVFTDPTGSTAVTYYTTQHFDIGNEDLDMDITPMVNDWLSGGSSNNGIGIAYNRFYELLSTDTRYISSFYTENTNTAYKPYIEVSYNQYFIDDRLNVNNNRFCKLFLYTFSGNDAANYFSAASVSIKTLSNANVYTGLTPTQIDKGVYYVDIWMSGANKGQQYKDVWEGVTFNPGIDKQDYVQYFTVQDNYYFRNAPQVNAYSLTTYGIDNDSIISTEENIRIYCDLRVNFSTNAPKSNYAIEYKMIMNNQDEVIPWTLINQAVIDKCPSNYFDLQTNWLLQNQTYEIQFRVKELGTARIQNEKIRFKVLRKF